MNERKVPKCFFEKKDIWTEQHFGLSHVEDHWLKYWELEEHYESFHLFFCRLLLPSTCKEFMDVLVPPDDRVYFTKCLLLSMMYFRTVID